MRSQKISFPDQQALCIFPANRSELPQAVLELQLNRTFPVIVLIGGEIETQYETVTHQAIQIISCVAEELNVVIICGGTDMGIMAEIGQARRRNQYKFPLVGIAPEYLVTWPGGPLSTKLLWWGRQRWQLAEHYSHFILVPGDQFGDESPWIVDTATMVSKGYRSLTILINGGEVSRKDIELSLANGRPVIALSRTGRLADELASQPDRHELLTIVPAIVEKRIVETISVALSDNEKNLIPKPETEN